MSSICVDKLNYLIYSYLKESQLPHTAEIFKHESSTSEKYKSLTLPPFTLPKLIDDGLKMLNWKVRYDNSDKKLRPFYKELTLIDASSDDLLDKRRNEITQYCTVFGNYRKNISPLFVDHNPVKRLAEYKHHNASIISCKWDPTSETRFVVSSVDSNASILLSKNSKNIRECITLRHNYFGSLQAYPKECEITDIQWSTDGTEILTVTTDTTVRIWSATNGCFLRTLTSKHSDGITSARWNPEGTLVATSSLDGTCIVWCAKTCRIRQRNSLHKGPVLSVAWANNTMHASCSTDCKIILWDLGIRIPIQTLVGHSAQVTCIDWNAVYDDNQSGWLASGADDGTVRVWTRRQRLCVHNFTTTVNCPILWLQWSKSYLYPDQVDLLAALCSNSVIRVWNGISGDCLQNVLISGGSCSAFSPDGLFILIGSSNGSFEVVESVRKSKAAYKFELSHEAITDVDWEKNGNLVIAGTLNGTVYMIELNEK